MVSAGKPMHTLGSNSCASPSHDLEGAVKRGKRGAEAKSFSAPARSRARGSDQGSQGVQQDASTACIR